MSDKKITVTTTPKNRIVVTKGSGGYSSIDTLVELQDVDTSNVKNDDVLVYVSANQKFVFKEVPSLNSSFQTANAAFDKANAANVLAYTVGINANAWANTKVSSVTGTSGQIYSSQGTTPTLNLVATGVNAVTYGAANQIPVITVDTFGRLTAAANVSVQSMDYAYANLIGAASNNWANTLSISDRAFANGTANSANAYSITIGAASNTWANSIGTAGNNYTNAVGVAGNNRSNTIGAASNAWANSVGTAGNNYVNSVAASSNTWANTKLSNTGGITFAGSLNFAGNVTAGNIQVTGTTTYISANAITIGASEINSISVLAVTAADQIIDTFSQSYYRSANYTISMNAGTDFQTTQVNVIHNDVDVFLTEFGTIQTTSNNLGTFSAALVSGNIYFNVATIFANTRIRMLRITNS